MIFGAICKDYSHLFLKYVRLMMFNITFPRPVAKEREREMRKRVLMMPQFVMFCEQEFYATAGRTKCQLASFSSTFIIVSSAYLGHMSPGHDDKGNEYKSYDDASN